MIMTSRIPACLRQSPLFASLSDSEVLSTVQVASGFPKELLRGVLTAVYRSTSRDSMNAVDRSFVAPDGRRIAYAEWGDAAGTPVVYCHGLPGPRLEARLADAPTRLPGMRLIAPDRPGFGLSSFAAPGERRIFRDGNADSRVDRALAGGTTTLSRGVYLTAFFEKAGGLTRS